MKRYRLATRAIADMEDITAYTLERWGRAKAIEYVDALRARFAWLADNPMSGRQRSDIRSGLRSFRQGSHLVFYLVEADGIHIVGVPHGAMDVTDMFD